MPRLAIHFLKMFFESNEDDNLEIKTVNSQLNKSQYTIFIQSQIQMFKNGFKRQDAHDIYRAWCKEKKYKTGTMHNFKQEILKYCEEKKPSKNAQTNRPTYYVLKKEYYKYFGIDEIQLDDSHKMIFN